MDRVRDEGGFSQGFPSYIEYQCDRLLPVAKMLLGFSVVYLLGFGLIDYFKYPDHTQLIIFFRLMAALPLMLLLRLLSQPKLYPKVPKLFLILGLLSFSFFLALNLSIPGKKYIVVLVPVFYILAVIAMAPLFKTKDLMITFVLGFLVYYWTGFFYIQDNEYIKLVFPHMTAIVLFTLITVVKIKQSAEENYQLAHNLHWHSQYDELTTVLNRRGVFAWIENEKLFSGKSFEPISVVMLDLDHFKQINDEYGHDVGDEVIQQSAQLIKEELGENSAVSRFGGEEFLLILQEGSESQNLLCAQSILEKFRHLAIIEDNAHKKQITVSIGFVNHRQPNTFAQSLKMADDYMYHAKNNGRDQLVDGLENKSAHG